MTLITTCPSCETSFRVVADQLKLRRGLVRCGRCRSVFSGLERLRRLEEEGNASAAATGSTPGAPAHEDPGAPPDPPGFGKPAAKAGLDVDSDVADSDVADSDTADPGPEDYAPWRSRDEHANRFDDDLSPMTLAVDSSDTLPDNHEHSALQAEDQAWRTGRQAAAPSNLFRTPPARLAAAHATNPKTMAAASDLEEAPGSGAAEASEPEPSLLHDAEQRFDEELEAVARELDAWDDGESAIDYFSAERQRRGFIGRNGAWKLLAAATLTLLLGLQGVLANRDWLAARFPALEPAIAALGAPFGLRISLPRALDSLTIESFELQAAGRNGLFSVSAILRNEAPHVVRWPSMLLTLTDPGNRVLLRKAIDPVDYLPAITVHSGLRPRSERPIRIALEANELQPAGYSVTLFYR